MDIRELKDLLKNSTSVLILDEGEPSYVILDYDVYRRLIGVAENSGDKNGGDNGNSDNHANDQIRDLVETPEYVPEDVSGTRHQLSPQETEALERLNREIQALKEQIEREEQRAH